MYSFNDEMFLFPNILLASMFSRVYLLRIDRHSLLYSTYLEFYLRDVETIVERKPNGRPRNVNEGTLLAGHEDKIKSMEFRPRSIIPSTG